MKRIYFLSFGFLSMFLISSCTNDIDEIIEKEEHESRTVEPRFIGENLNETQATALINKFLDAPDFFYFKDVIGFDPENALYASNFEVVREGLRIFVRSINVNVVGKSGYYGVWGKPTTLEEYFSLNKNQTPLGEPVYDESDLARENPVGMRYRYTTNGRNGGQHCWGCINWRDAINYEYFIHQND